MRFVLENWSTREQREKENERKMKMLSNAVEKRLLINLGIVEDKRLTFVTRSEANMLTKDIEWCAFVDVLT